MQVYEIDPADPLAVVKAHFSKLVTRTDMERIENSGVIEVVVEEPSQVVIGNDRKAEPFDVELIDAARYSKDRAYIHLSTPALSFQTAITLAKQVASSCGLESSKFDRLVELGNNGDGLERLYRTADNSGDVRQSLELRRAYTDDNQWRMMYSIDFPL